MCLKADHISDSIVDFLMKDLLVYMQGRVNDLANWPQKHSQSYSYWSFAFDPTIAGPHQLHAVTNWTTIPNKTCMYVCTLIRVEHEGKEYYLLLGPTQLWMKLQCWSISLTHRLQTLQCFDLIGRSKRHVWHNLDNGLSSVFTSHSLWTATWDQMVKIKWVGMTSLDTYERCNN